MCLGMDASPDQRKLDACVESAYASSHLQADGDEVTCAPLDPAQSSGSAQQAAGFLQQAVREEASKEQRLQRELSPEQYSLWKEKQMKAQRVSRRQHLGDMLPAAMCDRLRATMVGPAAAALPLGGSGFCLL